MMQCKRHQTTWMDQSFSGGSCAECDKDRVGYIQQIDKLTTENRELREQMAAMKVRLNDRLEDDEDV